MDRKYGLGKRVYWFCSENLSLMGFYISYFLIFWKYSFGRSNVLVFVFIVMCISIFFKYIWMEKNFLKILW